ncbi:uncharacterized protein V6R79_008424 [Siganus canaliculatus]
MMEVRLLLALLLAAALTGSDAQSDVCGLAPLNSLTRIVGGYDADEGAWPWQVHVEDETGYCAGTLITDQWVLTIASCFSSHINVSVTLGTNTLVPPSGNHVIRNASNVVVHPNYNPQTVNHNIALVQLSSPVTFTDYIKPVCLASADSDIDVGTTMWTTGWGRLYFEVDLPPPYRLQQVTIPVVSNEECAKIYPQEVTEDMMCAGGQSGRGPCNGDGGGPLMLKSGSRWVQAGVKSFGSPQHCGEQNLPDGFMRVSYYQQWITSVTGSEPPGFVKAGAPGPAPVALLLGAALVLSSVLVV